MKSVLFHHEGTKNTKPRLANSWQTGGPCLGGAEADIDRILLETAQVWGIEAAERYDFLLRAVFAAVAAVPDRLGSQAVARVAGIRVYP